MPTPPPARITRLADIGHVADTTGRLHGHARQQRREVRVQPDVRPGQHAGAGDIGAQQAAQAGARVAQGQVIQRHPGVLGPAVHRQLPLALGILPCVQRNGDALGAEFIAPSDHLIGAAHRQ
ncbi:hypothetical protein G6F68_018150 [Rhizopus microsporus]|nr:hypothetical protein G6F68_018150 [Rhizopus microsporus]